MRNSVSTPITLYFSFIIQKSVDRLKEDILRLIIDFDSKTMIDLIKKIISII